MSRKVKYTVMAKIEAAERYLRGEASAAEIAVEMKMPKTGERRILEWAAIYRENGIEGFHLKEGNGSYTAEEKQQAAAHVVLQSGAPTDIGFFSECHGCVY